MKFLPTILGFVLVLYLAGCSASDKTRAKEQSSQDLRNATDEMRKAGNEIKADAQELSRGVSAAVQPDKESASDKMSHAEAEAKQDASRAGIQLDHAALLAKVKTKLASDAGFDTLAKVDVSVDGSVVTLSGTVTSDAQKRAAETAASQVDGVTSVQDRLAVQP